VKANDVIRYVTWQVLESGRRHRLPDWLVWNQDNLLLEGVAGDAEVGTEYVIMVRFLLGTFYASAYLYRRIRRQ